MVPEDVFALPCTRAFAPVALRSKSPLMVISPCPVPSYAIERVAFSFTIKLASLLNLPYPTSNFEPVERIPPSWKSKKLSVPDKLIFELFPLMKAPLEKILVADIICKSLNTKPSDG